MLPFKIIVGVAVINVHKREDGVVSELRGKCFSCGVPVFYLGRLPEPDNQFCDKHQDQSKPSITPEMRARYEKDLEELRAKNKEKRIAERKRRRANLRRQAHLASLGLLDVTDTNTLI